MRGAVRRGAGGGRELVVLPCEWRLASVTGPLTPGPAAQPAPAGPNVASPEPHSPAGTQAPARRLVSAVAPVRSTILFNTWPNLESDGSPRRWPAQVSMFEMALSGEDDRGAAPVGQLDRLLVLHRAAGMDDRRHPGIEKQLGRVGEREEGVAGRHRSLGALARL